MSMSFVEEHKVFEMKKSEIPEILRCGETKGPYRFKRLREKSMNGLQITLFDIVGEMYHISVDENPITRRIQASPNPLFANCVVLLSQDFMQILMTKDVMGKGPLFATLIAEKFVDGGIQRKFDCSKCHKAQFSSIERLKTHEELYCDFREMEVTSTAEHIIDRPNLLLLPLAYHDLPKSNAIQILGPMHSILPVAIGRNQSQSFTTTPLTLANVGGGMVIPPNLNISLPQLTINIPVNGGGMVDLASLVRSTTASSSSSSPQSKSSEPEKPFPCTCGVSFSSEHTYEAHRSFYCKNAPNSKIASEFNNKRLLEKCGQCDFQPQSSSQLAVHIRTAHQNTRTFICNICRYRAFSMRGIRTHMRSHSPDSAMKFEAK